MKLLYLQEHLTCYNYNAKEDSVIENKVIGEGLNWNFSTRECKIIFVTEGELHISYGKVKNETISKGEIVLLPVGYKVNLRASTRSGLTIFRLRTPVQLCDRFALKQLLKGKEDFSMAGDSSKNRTLEMNEMVWTYLDGLNQCINDGLQCFYYYDIKVQELFFLFRAYYTKEQLLDFFCPLITHDSEFADFVLNNHHKAKNVSELAEMANYSVSGFEKRFKNTFGVSAGKWLKQQKAMRIYHEINCSEKAFKNISFDYGFSSPSHFNDYCKAHFGLTPGEIREKGNAN
ncbi:MAG: helix-turn-helix transcriptional regulator [Dysgonomonas sp.]|nr:helix-turn-helix transcriptional regulator [Dysgonomonas sp.]